MNFNWNLDLGQLITFATMLVGFGVYKQKLNQVEMSLREIKDDLRGAIRDNTLLGNTVSVLQQRMVTAEEEIKRARANIHRIANHIQGAQVIVKEGGDE